MSGAVPRWITPRTPGSKSFGPGAGELSETLGAAFMPWQTLAADGGLEVRPGTSKLARRLVIISTPRQAGKTTLARAVQVRKAALGRCVFTTAQTRKHAARRWNDATAGVERILNGTMRQRRTITSDMVVKRTTGVDHECLTWLATGGTVEPFAPNEAGAHSESLDDVFVDEGWAFTVEQADALQAAYSPAQSARPDPQEWLLSTAGSERSAWWAGVIRGAREAVELGTPGVFFVEYSCPDVIDGVSIYELDDDTLLDVIFAHHPADGYTLNRDVVRGDLDKVHRGQMTRQSFIRGYGNLQPMTAGLGAWPGSVWTDAGTELAPVGQVGLGVDVDPDGREWALVAAGRSGGDRVVWEVIERRDGTPGPAEAELVAQVVKAQRPVAVFAIGSGASVDFADLLDKAGVEVQQISRADLSAATSRAKAGIEQMRVLHRRQPSLTAAQEAATLQASGDNRYWARAGGRPIATLQAATLAGWALDHPAGPTGRFQIFVPRRAS